MLVTHFQGPHWCTTRSEEQFSVARGYAFCGGVYCAASQLAERALLARSDKEVLRFLSEANGSFGLGRFDAGSGWVAADYIRSYPVYYGTDQGTVYVSDDPNWILSKLNDQSLDNESAFEFLLTGYVTGTDTLRSGIKQLQAGEVLFVADSESGALLNLQTYYCLSHKECIERNPSELLSNLDSALVRIFGRLIESVRGRTIVIPLSGGHDSRLAALMLKRLGYRDVLCFTYGIPGNWETRISHAVARLVGYPWTLVPYSQKRWRGWYTSEQLKEYRLWSGGVSTTAHFQDWPAVKQLHDLGKIAADAVFVPGHSADFLAGSHIPDSLLAQESRPVDSILDKHYHLWDWSPDRRAIYPWLSARVSSRLISFPSGSIQDSVNAFENWDWRERQAKYICNSVRVYESWGYEWRMPFWDTEFIRFWQDIPYTLRQKKQLYLQYFDRFFPDLRVPGRSLLDKVLDRAAPMLGHDLLNGFSFIDSLADGKLSWRARSPISYFVSNQLRDSGVDLASDPPTSLLRIPAKTG